MDVVQKIRTPTSCLAFLLLFIAIPSWAELSVTSKWRIEQAIHRCKQTDNMLTHSDYWGDSVTADNQETVCIAEQFAQQAASDGDAWLQNKSGEFINQCKEQAEGSDDKYFACLNEGVQAVLNQLTSTCKELGQEGLWDTARCNRLVSYIFLRDFDQVLAQHQPLLKKLAAIRWLRLLFNPITALAFLLAYVLNVILWIDPGNWMRVPKVVMVVGIMILVSMFLENEWRLLGFALATIISVVMIIFDHIKRITSPKTKEKKKAAMTIKRLLQ